MKKVLIFSASIGGGHNEAASSLEKEFINHGFVVKKLDALKEINKVLDILILASCKILMNNFPKLYGNLYDISNKDKANKLLTSVFSNISKEKIYNIILEEKPDLIVGTHCLVVSVVGYLKENGFIDIPFVSIVTDYDAHKTYVNDYVDAYITGSNYTNETLEKQGIPKSKTFSYGIPIKAEFLKKSNPSSNNKGFQILLMGGSLGLKGMKKVLRNIVNIRASYNIVVVCGNDKELRLFIEREYSEQIKSKKITLYGFTMDIPKIMENSDVIITKPGGLTVSEAIAKKLPMIIPYYIPGQEKENLDFLVKEGAAIYVYDIDCIKEMVEYIMDNPRILDEIKSNMEKMNIEFCTDDIVCLSESLMEEYNYEVGYRCGY